MIAIECECGKNYRVDDSFAGKTVRCKRCGHTMAIPQLMVSATPHGALPDTPATHKVPHSTPAPFGERRLSQLDKRRSTPDRPPRESHSADRRPAAYENRGGYDRLQMVTHGGQGKISIAHDTTLKRDVALKELRDHIAMLPEARQRFVAEAEITGQLEHPGVVPIYALGADKQGNPFYTMRFVEGQTLAAAIEEYHQARRPADLNRLLRRFMMVCQTMAYAHQRGVIHRDLKPANIMFGKFGETLVMDWGLAKPLGRDCDQSTLAPMARQLADRPDLTAADAVVGTAAYMPPEQARGKVDELGVAADVYSLGAVLYQILTGVPPYTGNSNDDILEQVIAGPPREPARVCPAVPPALAAVCAKAMAREPADRYSTASELAENVEHWLDDEPVDSFTEPWRERMYRWARKHKSAVVSGAAALALVLLVTGVATVVYLRERDKARALQLLADDYQLQAKEANENAQRKETEANRLAEEAETSRQQASDAMQSEAQARQAAEEAQKKVTGLESELAAKGGQNEELAKSLTAARAELADAQSRSETESRRADAAAERATELQRQVIALRAEADEYRAVALKFTRLAAELVDHRQPAAVVANTPWEDFAQRDPATFDAVASDGSAALVAADATRARDGHQALRVSTATGSGVCLTYPKSRDANWDLSNYEYLSFAFSIEDPNAKYREGGLVVRIGHGSQSIEYLASREVLSLVPKGWANVKVPLSGDERWDKKEPRELDLRHVDWIEIELLTSSPHVTMWLDDFSFGADSRQVVRQLVPDPDRAAAEYVVATKGEVEAYVEGEPRKIHTMSDIPKEPFQVIGAAWPWGGGQDVTDDVFKLFSPLTDCRTIAIFSSKITDAGLEHLKGLQSIETLRVYNAPVIGSFLKHFAGHPKLSSLELEGTRVNDGALAHLAELPNLSGLNLKHTPISGWGLKHLAGNAKVNSIVLSYTQLNDAALPHIASLPNLKSLDIGATKVTDDGMKALSAHANLAQLNVIGTAVSPAGLGHLKAAPLEGLWLSTSKGSMAIPAFKESRLRWVAIHAEPTNGEIDDSFFGSLARTPSIRALHLFGAAVDDNMAKRVARIEGLTTLQITSVLNRWGEPTALPPAALNHLAAMPNLELLLIDYNVILNDENLHELAVFTKLKTLQIHFAEVKPESVIKLQAALPNCRIVAKPEIQQAIDKLRAKQ